MSQTIEDVVLARAIALLEAEERWTFGAWARNAGGMRCHPLSIGARQWCAVGALQVSAYQVLPDLKASTKIAHTIAHKLAPGPGGLVYINECGDHRLVRAVMRGSRADTRAVPAQSIFSRAGFAAFARAKGS